MDLQPPDALPQCLVGSFARKEVPLVEVQRLRHQVHAADVDGPPALQGHPLLIGHQGNADVHQVLDGHRSSYGLEARD